ADVVGAEAPAGGAVLHLTELLLGQGDQRRGVVGDLAAVQRLEQGGLGDERLAGAGRGADQDARVGGEPGEQGLLLDRVGRVGQLVEVEVGQFVAAGGAGGHEWVSGGLGAASVYSPLYHPRPGGKFALPPGRAADYLVAEGRGGTAVVTIKGG